MFVIFGMTNRDRTIRTGRFHCPNCQVARPFEHNQVQRYFHIFFIPLFATGEVGEYVECQFCRTRFNTAVLRFKPRAPRPQATQPVDDIRRDLDSGMPIQMVRKKLINSGMVPEVAERMVDEAVGGYRRACHECGYSYRGTVRRCSSCGEPI